MNISTTETVTVDADADVPLVVDLDGTLIQSDLLVESFLWLFAHQPMAALKALPRLKSGKQILKAELAQQADISIPLLPWNQPLLDFLHAEKAKGRQIVLATASNIHYAEQVAAHLGLFDQVMGSCDTVNLIGKTKADKLVATFGEGGFDYVGDSRADLHVWPKARIAYGANLQVSATRLKAGGVELAQVFDERRGLLRELPHLLRMHQWLKNLLIFLPLMLAHALGDFGLILQASLAFVAFSMTASSVYLINDLLDITADRKHERKRNRPIPAGRVPALHAMLMAPALLGAALLLALLALPFDFFAVLAGYFALTLGYSMWFKQVQSMDIVLLALLYTIRIYAGAEATDIPVSYWLLGLSLFFFFSLACLKRDIELRSAVEKGKEMLDRRGYRPGDEQIIAAAGLASGFVSILVMALYIQSDSVRLLYNQPQVLWLLCPLLIYWLMRAWILGYRGEMHDDPVVFAATDKVSMLVGVLGAAVLLGASL